jgi:WD40 repeat protein
LYWLTAKPGTGKSIVLGYVINHLEGLRLPCAFYFFTYGDKTKFSISLFLRSIAWQIASNNKEVFDYVLGQCKKDAHLVNADYRTIWRKLFLEGIFKIQLPGKHYLVIDALDECLNNPELIPLLVKSAGANTLRVFLTSRNSFETYGVTCPQNLTIVSEKIAPSSTAADIGLYITTNLHNLPALGPDKNMARKAMMNSIIEKSSGCFLWVRLVLSELRNVHTSEEVRQVLEEIPSDMDQLYSYILASMSELKRGKPLTKAILAWTVCATRPLTTSELHAALELDMDDTVDDMERSIATTCGQLVYVDSKARVQVLHQTAREFLLRPNNTSEFAIVRKEGHKRLAMVCLKYLCGSEMAGPKPRKLSATKQVILRDRSAFQGYACNALPEHIPFVSSEDDEFFQTLSRFLSGNNLLSWIEYIAKESDLNRLILTGRALKQYIQRRSKYVVPMGKDTALLNAWSIDLVRLVTHFGRNLSKSPSSIHHLIPPFCPPDSVLKTQFGSSRRSIVVNGLRATAWDDCSSVIAYQQESPTALACSLALFAIGQRSGKIRIHDETTCQEVRVLSHQQPVRLLRFGQNGTLLASVASKSVCIWNVETWAREWRFEIDSVCIDVSFLDHDLLLLAVLLDNRIVVWDLTTGAFRNLESWVDELDEDFVSDRPITATIGGGSTMLAVAYRGHDVIVWDIENESIHDIYGQDVGSLGPHAKKRPGIASVISLLFSPVADSALLAAGYNDGEIVVFDTIEHKVQARTQANAHSIVSSPDGMLLACGNSAGIILIYDFENLKLVYRIVSEEYSIKSLVFSANSQRLIDIRGPYCRVWDPPALLRDDLDHNSDTVSVSTTPQDYMVHDFDPVIPISTFVCCENENIVICGKIDGSICLFDGKTGKLEQELVHNTCDSAITCLCYDSRSSILTSADIDSSVVSYRLSWDQKICRAEKVFERREGMAITQLLANDGCTRLLISTPTTDTLCTSSTDGYSTILTAASPDRKSHKWSTHPADPTQLIFFADNTAHIFLWATLERITPSAGIQMTGSILPELFISSTTSCFGGEVIATTFAESLASGSKSKLFLWPTTSFTAKSTSAAPIPHYQPLADDVETLMGIYNQRLVFLHKDGWVCSADSQNFSTELFDRHFFFPTDWLSTSGMGRLMLGISGRSGNILFVQRDEVAVVLNGLDTFDGGVSRGKRPSISGSVRSGLVNRPLHM